MSNPPAQEAPPAPGPPSVRQTRQQNRKDVRRTLTFLRAMNGLRESFPQLARFDVKLRIYPTFEIVSAPEWESVKNLLARFRPIYLDSDDASFRKMVKLLPNHLTVQPNPFPGIEGRWDAILVANTATIPTGTRIVGPGVTGVSEAPGTMQIGFDGEILTGREAIDLSLYGELTHIDLGKHRKLLRINESFVAPSYRFAVISIPADMVRTADELRWHATEFIELFRRQLGDAKLGEIESEFDPGQ